MSDKTSKSEDIILDPSPKDVQTHFMSIVQQKVSLVTSKQLHSIPWWDVAASSRRQERSTDKTSNNTSVTSIEEAKILKSHLVPLYWGFGSALISLLSFRVSKYTGRILRRSNGIGFTFETFAAKRNGLQNESIRNHAMCESSSMSTHKGRDDNIQRHLSVLSDMTISTLIGCSATLFLLDTNKLQNDLAQIPLIQGKSYIADEMCLDFISEYQKYPPEFWNQTAIKEDGQYSMLHYIQQFVTNCQERNKR